MGGLRGVGGRFVKDKGIDVMSTTITSSSTVDDGRTTFSIGSPILSPHTLKYAENMSDYTESQLDDSQSIAVTAHTDLAPQAETQEQPFTDLTAVKVLLVEDNMDLAEIIIESLRLTDMRIDVDHATHGTRAIEKFKALNPALVLLDLHLPDMSGWRILDSINDLQSTLPKEARTRIIVITSYDDPPNRLISKLQGITYYLTKPITMDELESVVRQALNGDE